MTEIFFKMRTSLVHSHKKIRPDAKNEKSHLLCLCECSQYLLSFGSVADKDTNATKKKHHGATMTRHPISGLPAFDWLREINPTKFTAFFTF